MSKLSEIFDKIIGLDPNGDYDFNLEESKNQNETENKPQNETAQPETPPVNISPQLEEMQKNLEQARNEIDNLKQVNYALLMRTNMPDNKDKPVEELIYNLCVPHYIKKGSDTNG